MTATAGRWDKTGHLVMLTTWPILGYLPNKWARRLGWQFTKEVERNAPHGTSCRVERFAPLN